MWNSMNSHGLSLTGSYSGCLSSRRRCQFMTLSICVSSVRYNVLQCRRLCFGTRSGFDSSKSRRASETPRDMWRSVVWNVFWSCGSLVVLSQQGWPQHFLCALSIVLIAFCCMQSQALVLGEQAYSLMLTTLSWNLICGAVSFLSILVFTCL